MIYKILSIPLASSGGLVFINSLNIIYIITIYRLTPNYNINTTLNYNNNTAINHNFITTVFYNIITTYNYNNTTTINYNINTK
jgi:hypothetical protein